MRGKSPDSPKGFVVFCNLLDEMTARGIVVRNGNNAFALQRELILMILNDALGV